MRFYIVRHGQTLFNRLHRIQGWCDSPLTSKGIEQASALYPVFKDIAFSAAYSSDSGRARQTRDQILQDRKVTRYEDERLREVFFGDLEGEKVRNAFPDGKVDFNKYLEYGGEKRPEAAKRFKDALRDISKKEKGPVLLVSHGSVIRQFLEEESTEFQQRVLNEKNTNILVPNCSVTQVDVKDDIITICHLPEEIG